MNNTIESYLLDFKKMTKAGQKLTDKERERFENVTYGRVHNQLLNLYPEETLIIEAINPLTGEVICQSSCGRATINLKHQNSTILNEWRFNNWGIIQWNSECAQKPPNAVNGRNMPPIFDGWFLTSLGYREEKTERGNDVYVIGPTLFEKKNA